MIPYRNKLRWIEPYIKNKDVLDLGCVDHTLGRSDRPWLHGFIREHARRVVGVDLVTDALEELRQRGLEVVQANVEEMELGETFDVIVAGDILEHLNNPGKMLEHAASHLRPEGRLLITTPNPFTLVRIARAIVLGRVGANVEHTCWFCETVLRELASRYGLEADDISYVDDTRFSYRLWRSFPGPKRNWKDHVRPYYAMMRNLIWRPTVMINSLAAIFRPCLSETLCMSFGQKIPDGSGDRQATVSFTD